VNNAANIFNGFANSQVQKMMPRENGRFKKTMVYE